MRLQENGVLRDLLVIDVVSFTLLPETELLQEIADCAEIIVTDDENVREMLKGAFRSLSEADELVGLLEAAHVLVLFEGLHDKDTVVPVNDKVLLMLTDRDSADNDVVAERDRVKTV